MKRSSERILTTHVGSLPLVEGAGVADVVRKQREIGLDLINEGEYTKGGDWLSFVESRFTGFSEQSRPAGELPLVARGKDREQFAEFYAYATEHHTLSYEPGKQIRTPRPYWVSTGPLEFVGQ